MKELDFEWMFNRILGLKCCLTCRRYEKNNCKSLSTMIKFLKEAEDGKFAREYVGSKCLEWL